ncbi:MAG: TonB family protein [Myxococcales bacterium]|nr:TonB family protein [Myxococcales bacterium]
MSKDFGGKILRIGVIQGAGAVVDERSFLKREEISVGSATDNTFVLSGDDVPLSMPLFRSTGAHYVLVFDESVSGKLSVQERVADLALLREKGIAKRTGDHWELPLNPETKGKLVIGGTTILFQFVNPPGTATVSGLPKGLTTTIWRRMDIPLLLALMFSLVSQGGTIGSLHYWWEVSGKFQVRPKRESRFLERLVVQVQFQKKEEEEVEDKKDKKPDEEDKKEEETVDSKPILPPPVKKDVPVEPAKEQPKDPEEIAQQEIVKKEMEYQKKVEKVRSSTILVHLQSTGGQLGEGTSAPLTTGATARKLEQAWEANGVVVADGTTTNEFRGGPKKVEGDVATSYKSIGKADIVGPKAGVVAVDAKDEEVKVKAKIGGSLGEGMGTGSVDKAAVAKVFMSRKTAIRYCYETVLRTAPDTDGKVTIQFTIGPAGRVTSVEVTQNSTGSDELANCIVAKVKGWVFPKPENGSVTFAYPFVLSTGG